MLDQTTLLIRDADSRRESAPSDVKALRLAGEAREP